MKYVLRRLKHFFLWDVVQKQNLFELLFKLNLEREEKITFHGQLNQDMFAYLYFKGKRNGFYVDIGANDGKTGSNTLLFEELGWDGVCIEPLPEVYNTLIQNRKCKCYNVAISDKNEDEVEFIRASGAEMLSGLSSEMSEAHKQRIVNENAKMEKITVKTKTLDAVIQEVNRGGYIDFLSIDVEGAEISILKSIDFTKYKFGLITLESNKEVKGEEQQIKDFMDSKGYNCYAELTFDLMFVPK